MFCILLADKGKRRRGKPFYRRPKIENIKYGDSHYDIIRATMKKGKLYWPAIARAIRGRPFITQVDINMPDDFKSMLFDSSRYRQHIEIHSALTVLQLASKYKRSVSVALIDKDCCFCGCLKPLMTLSNEVYIITKQIEQYTEYANECYSLFGAAPVVTDGYGVAERCNVILCPDGRGVIDTDKCVFAPLKECWHIGKNCITTVDGCPEGIDEIDFAAALYELCNIKRMANITAGFMTAMGVKEPLDAIVRRICLDIK